MNAGLWLAAGSVISVTLVAVGLIRQAIAEHRSFPVMIILPILFAIAGLAVQFRHNHDVRNRK